MQGATRTVLVKCVEWVSPLFLLYFLNVLYFLYLRGFYDE
jgi:hypothetical protein